MPGAVFDYRMIVYAVAPGQLEGAVGELIHAHRAGRRLIPFQWIPGDTPSPVRVCDGVACAFSLGERGEQFRRDDGRRMLAEQRAIFLPGFCRTFIKRVP